MPRPNPSSHRAPGRTGRGSSWVLFGASALLTLAIVLGGSWLMLSPSKAPAAAGHAGDSATGRQLARAPKANLDQASGDRAKEVASRSLAKARKIPFKVSKAVLIQHKSKAQLKAAAKAAAAALIASRTFSFTIGTFNVLGSQHSTPSGDHSSYPSARVRSPRAVGVIRHYGLDIVGLQEAQPDQLNAIQHGLAWAAYPGYAFGADNTDNSILYNPARFEMVSGTSFSVHFMHADRPQTVLRLRDKGSGREFYVINMHVSAGHDRANSATRYAGVEKAIGYINALKAQGLPIFLTGDMNDREAFFCHIVPRTGMVSSMGGNAVGGCHPPAREDVDWVMGWNASFSNYIQDRATLHSVSDHFFIAATAHVG